MHTIMQTNNNELWTLWPAAVNNNNGTKSPEAVDSVKTRNYNFVWVLASESAVYPIIGCQFRSISGRPGDMGEKD